MANHENRLWFDTVDNRIVEAKELERDYVVFMAETCKDEEQREWMIKNPGDYTFEAWLDMCHTHSGGTLIEITNANEYMRRQI